MRPPTIPPILILLLPITGVLSIDCACNGIEIEGQDQTHCWEVVAYNGNGWIDGDSACQTLGGHLGHPQDNYGGIVDYLKTVYKRPVLTGIIVGNLENGRYGMTCPNNEFYELIDDEKAEEIVGTNATNTSMCAFISDTDYKVHFEDCQLEADALCDRPMEKPDYCNIVMNCTITTTISMTTTTTLVNNSVVPQPTDSPSGGNPPVIIPPGDDVGGPTTAKNPLTPSQTCPTVKPSDCSDKIDKCGKNEWRIFGMCIDWRLLLLLLALLLLLCGCCWILHCCLSLCMWCRPKKKKENKQDVEAPIAPKMVVAPVPVPAPPRRLSYSAEPDLIAPPAAVTAQPVMLPVPTVVPLMPPHKEIIKEYTREIRMIHPDKPVMKDVGCNTDPWEPLAPKTIMVKPKRKKAEKPKPRAISPIEEDLGDEISIDIPRSPSPAESIQPAGDLPLVFHRNAKPDLLGEGPPTEKREFSPSLEPFTMRPPNVISVVGNPRAIRSPPMKEKRESAPRTFSPISDISDSEPPSKIRQNFPSPPTAPKRRPPTMPVPEREQEPLRNERLEPTPTKNPERSVLPRDRTPSPSAPKKPKLPSVTPKPSRPSRATVSPFEPEKNRPRSAEAPVDYPGRNKTPERSRDTPIMMKPDVSMRAARGKLGGVVRAGSGGGETPTGWKPWAKTAKGFTGGAPFLDEDM